MKKIKKRGFITGLSVLCTFLIISTTVQAQNFGIRGRIHMDAFYGIYEADEFVNGFNNRRARMGMDGRLNDHWDGKIEVDFADGKVTPKDFFLRRSFENGGRLRIGYFKKPHGLSQLTSDNRITFIERSAMSNMGRNPERMGLGYELFKTRLGFSSMVFGRALGQRDALEDDMPLGVALRGVYAPEVGSGRLHFGASVVYEDLRSNTGIRYSDHPEALDSKGGSVKYLDVSIPDAENTLLAGVEILYLNGPFSVEGEYLQTSVGTAQGNDPAFHGYHVQAGYVLTGESRSYSTGFVGGISPENDSGAWEVAVRYSLMDLRDDIYVGDKQSNVTFALNRYVTSNLRFMGNVVIVSTENLDRTPVLGVARVQYFF
ncbi:MAG: OprO/OprP family phosphate-selective porin [Bacteroidales bacterium]